MRRKTLQDVANEIPIYLDNMVTATKLSVNELCELSEFQYDEKQLKEQKQEEINALTSKLESLLDQRGYLARENRELERHLAESADFQRDKKNQNQKEINLLNKRVDDLDEELRELRSENRQLQLRVQAMQSRLTARKLREVEAQLERLAEQEADGDTDTDDDSCVEEVS